MVAKKPEQYYGLKEISDFAKEEGIEYSTRELSVYKSRNKLPDPVVMIGKKAGWTKKQIDDWIAQIKLKEKHKNKSQK
ncbi:hypothetical protein F3157_19845 [Virgibacillus dakarensis]|uniref:Uncharacterized protein n=1 Tax=Lentibacillus populi TaxID=1827502 RepID=A0A9W5U139_9BACI|nr:MULTISPECIES: hypothetical protein [Bacillaceae]MBT2216985.1 hypothetical protein [Virgibacillus dakarensis]MTW87873.1 hypothetical protein [Virgibacillus dakarensis]GGB58874.1 hypothetical protein GCM10011409_40450 [Lentibacillus populi]